MISIHVSSSRADVYRSVPEKFLFLSSSCLWRAATDSSHENLTRCSLKLFPLLSGDNFVSLTLFSEPSKQLMQFWIYPVRAGRVFTHTFVRPLRRWWENPQCVEYRGFYILHTFSLWIQFFIWGTVSAFSFSISSCRFNLACGLIISLSPFWTLTHLRECHKHTHTHTHTQCCYMVRVLCSSAQCDELYKHLTYMYVVT